MKSSYCCNCSGLIIIGFCMNCCWYGFEASGLGFIRFYPCMFILLLSSLDVPPSFSLVDA